MYNVFTSVTWWVCCREKMIMFPARTTDYLEAALVPRRGEPPFKLFFIVGKYKIPKTVQAIVFSQNFKVRFYCKRHQELCAQDLKELIWKPVP